VKVFLGGIYLLVVLLYTALTKFGIGLPLRTLMLLFLSGLIVLAYFSEAKDFAWRHRAITAAFVALGIIGAVLTYNTHRSLGTTLDGLMANVVQPYLIFFCVLVLMRLLGVWNVALLTFAAAFLTAAVAVLQYGGLDFAWRLREITSEIQHEPSYIQAYVDGKGRALGLSLSPIVFSYHMVCTYMALNVLYRFNYMRILPYYTSVLFIMMATFANGTRSALLGIIVSEIIMELRQATWRSVLKVTLVGIAGILFYLYAESTGSRIADTEDASALGRVVLINYGLRLAADFPMGLGWDFNPAGYAWLYWEHLSDFVNADGVYRLGLHNAFLNFFLIYGVGGVLVALIVLLYDPRYVFYASLFMSAYVVHIVVHNNGMFLGDYFFWFAFAIILKIFKDHGIVYGATAPPPPVPIFSGRRQWT
jgi:hypothetical protein